MPLSQCAYKPRQRPDLVPLIRMYSRKSHWQPVSGESCFVGFDLPHDLNSPRGRTLKIRGRGLPGGSFFHPAPCRPVRAEFPHQDEMRAEPRESNDRCTGLFCAGPEAQHRHTRRSQRGETSENENPCCKGHFPTSASLAR
jgi:hypothetical protein